jgi:hypothetical protein
MEFVRSRKTCSDWNNAGKCALIWHMNDKNRFVFIGNKWIEKYKTCSYCEGNNTVTTIDENNSWTNNRLTCIGSDKKSNDFNVNYAKFSELILN